MDIPAIDGYAKGKVFHSANGHTPICVAKLPEITIESLTEKYDPYAIVPSEIVYYHIHRIYMFGRVVRVASVMTTPPRDEDLFETLVSDKGKNAAEL